MTRRIFLDTEWTAPPWSDRCELMWVGLADDDGQSWYGISAEVVIDPSNNPFVSGALRLIDPGEPRLMKPQLASAVMNFCGAVDEFWVWIPTLESFSAWAKLTEGAADAYAKSIDVDLRMLQTLVDPWPSGWPRRVHDLNAAALAAGVDVPARAPNHLHPRVHAEWNRELFKRVRAGASAWTRDLRGCQVRAGARCPAPIAPHEANRRKRPRTA